MSPLNSPSVILAARLEKYTRQPGGLAQLNEDQATQIVRQIRKLIEKDRLQATYPFAKLYCDWLQHNELGNPVALGVLEAINLRVIENAPVELVVPQLVGLAEFRQELIALFAAHSIPDNLLETGSLWLRFTSLLLGEIVGVPISFPENVADQGKVFEIRQRIIEAATADIGALPGGAKPIWFDRLLIEADEADAYLNWRLEFPLADGERWGVRGRLYFADGGSFRGNDLGFAPKTPERLRRAVDQVIAEYPAERLFRVTSLAGSS